MVDCECGCGLKVHGLTMNRKPARFIKGHTIKYIQKSGQEASHWKGGYCKHSNGYRYVWFPSHPNADSRGYVLEHVKAMSDSIGRALIKDEVVHHIDRNKQNNDISNLQLMTRSEHAKYHGKCRHEAEHHKRMEVPLF
jgi:hypothetical protein